MVISAMLGGVGASVGRCAASCCKRWQSRNRDAHAQRKAVQVSAHCAWSAIELRLEAKRRGSGCDNLKAYRLRHMVHDTNTRG